MIYPRLFIRVKHYANLATSLRPFAIYRYFCSNSGHSGFTCVENDSIAESYTASTYTYRDCPLETTFQGFAFGGHFGSWLFDWFFLWGHPCITVFDICLRFRDRQKIAGILSSQWYSFSYILRAIAENCLFARYLSFDIGNNCLLLVFA